MTHETYVKLESEIWNGTYLMRLLQLRKKEIKITREQVYLQRQKLMQYVAGNERKAKDSSPFRSSFCHREQFGHQYKEIKRHQIETILEI